MLHACTMSVLCMFVCVCVCLFVCIYALPRRRLDVDRLPTLLESRLRGISELTGVGVTVAACDAAGTAPPHASGGPAGDGAPRSHLLSSLRSSLGWLRGGASGSDSRSGAGGACFDGSSDGVGVNNAYAGGVVGSVFAVGRRAFSWPAVPCAAGACSAGGVAGTGSTLSPPSYPLSGRRAALLAGSVAVLGGVAMVVSRR